jgi:hypothetical protein
MLKEKINKLSSMSKNIKKTNSVVLLLAIFLTLLGSLSIVSVLMLLKSILKINFLIILALGTISASFYSYIANEWLKKIEQKNEIKMAEFETLEKKVKEELIQNYSDDIISRFNVLDTKKKIELLKTIKSEMFLNLDAKKIEKFDVFDLWFISETFKLDKLDKNSDIDNVKERKR